MLIDTSFPDIYFQCQRKMPKKSEDAWFIISTCQYVSWYQKVRAEHPLLFESFLRERFRVQITKCIEEYPLFKLTWTENDSE